MGDREGDVRLLCLRKARESEIENRFVRIEQFASWEQRIKMLSGSMLCIVGGHLSSSLEHRGSSPLPQNPGWAVSLPRIQL